MSKHIIITTITESTPNPQDPNPEGNVLKTYYFKDEPDGLNFYSPAGLKQNTTGIKLNEAFSVTIPVPNPPGPPVNKTFNLTVSSLGASGFWSDLNSTGDPGSGTFQAQASGTGPIEEEEEAASSATA